MTFTAEELQEYLHETVVNEEEGFTLFDQLTEMYSESGTLNIPGFGTAVFVEHVIDRTGADGTPQFVAFTIGDRLFALSGWYDSWAGGEWDGDIFEAERYEIVTHSYRPVSK